MKTSEYDGEWCLMMTKTQQPDVYELFLNIDNRPTYYDIAYIKDLEHCKHIREAFESSSYMHVKCCYSRDFHKWYPVKLNLNTPVKNINPADYV